MHLAEIEWETRRNELIAKMYEYAEGHSTRMTGAKYFIWYGGKAYPPKDIRGLWERKPKTAFSGGDGTNRLFYDLGFTVVKGTKHLIEYTEKNHREQSLRVQLFSVELEKLFQQRWVLLKSRNVSFQPRDVSDQPGVYLLAYTKGELENKPVELRDIFYVGMSTTALRTRLKQFSDGIEDGLHHSAAKRFFTRWSGGTPYSHLRTENKFFVVTLPLPCEPIRGLRTPVDLETMGQVTALEYFALAKIKDEIGLEPPLNKK